MQSKRLLKYLKQGVDELLDQGSFDGGQKFRKTQREALEAYKKYLNQHGLTPEEKLKGFFEIPTGAGKTAVFIGIIAAAHRAATQNGEELKTVIVVPTQQLMHQTLEAIQGNDKDPNDPEYVKGFAPHLKGHVGLYGDRHKNLKLPITVMTYDAWYDLSQSGEIGSHNIDILISDEAHRGTSERRVENITGVFNAQTAQIAFTATAHFDESKSVQDSHERQIFYKSIAESMKDDELAAYIESQRAVIRVEPDEFMLSEEFKAATKEERTAYRKKLRQAAWNRFAVKAYREGSDTRRVQPLSDNQAGFFVEGITQANQLEIMLNEDPVLQEKAKQQGRKGVAIAIHSALSPSEQRKRFKAYKRGEYMAVVGDDKFKEGFDHPPMKTIIDCPHKSLVDKAQIIGRGARKWWNTLKHHFEGMTIIDSVMYFGAPDKKRTERNRARALRKAVLTKDILGESYILGPAAPKPNKKRKGGGGSSPFDDDLDVEYYADIDEIHRFDGEISEIKRENYVELTEEDRKFIIDHKERTGIAPYSLIKLGNPPDGLNHSHIKGWYAKNPTTDEWKTRYVNKDHLEWVKITWAALPDKPPVQMVTLTQEDREFMQAQRDRTGVGPHTLVKAADVPNGLQGGQIYNWLAKEETGSWSIAVTKIPEDHRQWILEEWASLPDKTPEVTISDADVELMMKLRDQTGISPETLIANAKNVPEGLTNSQIRGWLTERQGGGKTKTTPQNFINWTLAEWRTYPEKAPSEIITITEENRGFMNAEIRRTGITPEKLISQSLGAPTDLSATNIRGWLTNKKGRGYTKSAPSNHLEWTKTEWAKYPDIKLVERVKLTDEDRNFMKSQWERTGVSPSQLFAKSAVKGELDKSMIEGWFLKKKGDDGWRVSTVRPDFLKQAKDKWASLPDKIAEPS